jgi:intracellular sulfur oxidation DsrE/DsrF family protein
MKAVRFVPLALTLLAGSAPLARADAPAAATAAVQEKVVYHISDSAQAMLALRNMEYHLDASPGARLVVVTHGRGIDFLLDGAQDDKGNPYEPAVQALKDRGVDFRVCNNTLTVRRIDPKTVIPEAGIVPSGVAEVGRLQAREGFVYLKP